MKISRKWKIKWIDEKPLPSRVPSLNLKAKGQDLCDKGEKMAMKSKREHKEREKSSLPSPKYLKVVAHEWGVREGVFICCAGP